MKHFRHMLLTVLAIFLLSCNLVNSIREVSSSPPGESIIAAEEIWPDIPVMTRMEQERIPLPDAVGIGVKIGFGTSGIDLSSTRLSYLAFRTEQSAEEVTTFYTSAIMEQYGWQVLNSDKCGKSRRSSIQVLGGNCGFIRFDASETGTMLIIFLQKESENSDMNVIFVRIDNFDPDWDDA